MAETALISASKVQKWLPQYFAEYVRASGFAGYMGKTNNNIIITKTELIENGNTINIPLVTRLKSDGVTGTSTLDGNEEELGNYNCSIAIDWLRNAVLVNKKDVHDAAFDIPMAAKSMLKLWSADKMRSALIGALGATDTSVTYANATTAQKNTWNANNSDRVLYGAATSNYNATHATALANVDSTNDKLNAAAVSLMKRLAKKADPHIRPYRLESEGREYFVMFAGPQTFRDLKTDSTITQANRDARPRSVSGNPLFQDGDLEWDGVLIREIPEITTITGVGNGNIDVGPVYLCGAQAVGVAWGQMPRIVTPPPKDYEFRHGIGTEEYRGVSKLMFNNVQQGIVSGFFSGVAD